MAGSQLGVLIFYLFKSRIRLKCNYFTFIFNVHVQLDVDLCACGSKLQQYVEYSRYRSFKILVTQPHPRGPSLC